MRAKLTVLIPCKDERLNIRPCIEAARQIADEILVADSGSTDETMEIVREIGGCRLIEREFVNYADFKNWAIPQASHPWVLVVDADERVTPELADEIREILRDPPSHLDGYWVRRRNHFMGREIKHCGWNSDKVFRLIRRSCRYGDCRVHEEIVVDPQRAGRLEQRLLHYTYWSYDQYFEKYVRYTKWGAMDMWDRGRRTSCSKLLFRPFLRFFLLYFIRLGILDGMAGLQICLLQSFFVSFVKQARLWEMEHAQPQPDPEAQQDGSVARPALPAASLAKTAA
jgi:glycosyltransferase involved in cell wall biosynthesis